MKNSIDDNVVRVKIHKGTDEIGGSCVELSTQNTTILLDYGTPLKEGSKQVRLDKKIDAVLISHSHQDHFGEITQIDKEIPIYCGALSLELMNAVKIFTGETLLQNNFKIFKAWEAFEIGDFKIHPYLVDHSATDAYAFLIEAHGKRVLYSGDFRANGRKSKLFENMLVDSSLKGVDVLLMEGTMLQRDNGSFADEWSVEEKIDETLQKNRQISFVISSSQNIDSIVSAYRASKKAGKIFVIDIYTAWILEKVKTVSSSVPNMFWHDVKVLRNFGGSYYQKLKEHEAYFQDFKYRVFEKGNVIDLDTIKIDPGRYLCKISPWHISGVLKEIDVVKANVIYSQWLGYLEEPYSNRENVNNYQELQDNHDWVYAHTGGHADLKALKRFANAIRAKKLIPIHTEHKEEFEVHFDNVTIMMDNESYCINDEDFTVTQAHLLHDVFKNETGVRDAG